MFLPRLAAKWFDEDHWLLFLLSSVSYFRHPSSHLFSAGHPEFGFGNPYLPTGQVIGILSSGSIRSIYKCFCQCFDLIFAYKSEYILTNIYKHNETVP